MTFLVRFCALCALLLSLHAAHAQSGPQPSPLLLDGSKSTFSLAGRSSYWVDTGGLLTVDQLEQHRADLPFSLRNRGNRLQLGPGAVLWVRFDARVVDTGAQWELELTHAGTDRVSLFHRRADGSWQAQHAGDRIAVRDWAYPDRYPVFALDPRADQTVTYWVRIEHARVPFSGELLVHNHNALRELRIQQQFLLGAYFGMALLLVATAVANAFVFRDTSFAAYAVYVTVLALALAASLGVGGQFIWPGWPRWNGLAEFVLLPLTAVTGLLFVRHVVQPRRIGRGLDRLALTLAGVFLALTAWDVVRPTATSLQALTAIGALTMALVYAMLWTAWRTGDRWVRWIALGILPVLLAGTLPVLRNFGLLSSGFLSQYGMVLAAVIEAPLLIYGLLQRSSVQHEAQTRARALALTEPLTGLTNRHNFMLRLHESLVRAQRYQHHSALLLIDLDNHRWFADTHGREVADRALVLTGSLLRSVARDVDTAGRVNDSTLALLMEGPVREAQVVAAATSIVAGGLRPSNQLPVGATLKFKVVLALLPDAASGADLESNAQAHLDWLGSGLDALRQDGRRTILKLNF